MLVNANAYFSARKCRMVMFLVASVCVSVCLSVSNADLTWKVRYGMQVRYIFSAFRSSSNIKVIESRSRSRSQEQKSVYVYHVCAWSAFD